MFDKIKEKLSIYAETHLSHLEQTVGGIRAGLAHTLSKKFFADESKRLPLDAYLGGACDPEALRQKLSDAICKIIEEESAKLEGCVKDYLKSAVAPEPLTATPSVEDKAKEEPAAEEAQDEGKAKEEASEEAPKES